MMKVRVTGERVTQRIGATIYADGGWGVGHNSVCSGNGSGISVMVTATAVPVFLDESMAGLPSKRTGEQSRVLRSAEAAAVRQAKLPSDGGGRDGGGCGGSGNAEPVSAFYGESAGKKCAGHFAYGTKITYPRRTLKTSKTEDY